MFNPIKWLLTKKVNEVSGPIAEVNISASESTSAQEANIADKANRSETDAVLARLRNLVVVAGYQSHEVIDDLIALAKKLG